MKPLGAPFAAKVALSIAETHIGQPARPLHRRDVDGVRGLAALMLHDEVGMSWPEVQRVLYHGDKAHTTALTTGQSWRGHDVTRAAMLEFRELLTPEVSP